MFGESEILIDALLTLMDQVVVALPIHDALAVPSSQVSIAQKVPSDAFKDQTGSRGWCR